MDSYDGDVETSSDTTNTDASATPALVLAPISPTSVNSQAPREPHYKQLQHRLTALQRSDELKSPQTSSRSNSGVAFSPGAHRRSHPNLQHLSLAPLTPKYPVTPSDYDAYVDPQTSQLHTSSSLSHIASMPSPAGVLSRSGSRASSKTRPRKNKSSVSIQISSSTPRGALTSQGFGGKMADPEQNTGPKKNDSSWLLQAGMALTEGSRESKGQSWLAKRASSTSLHSPAVEDYTNFEYTQARSGRDTPNRGRRGSRDRRKSRRELAMTPAAIRASSVSRETALHSPRASRAISTSASSHDFAAIEPDWADSQTQAEIAADLEMELANELEDNELYSDDEDRYGALDFEGQGIEDEEMEIKQAVRARGFRLGRWVDGVVDVFLKMDDGDEDELEVKHERWDGENVAISDDRSKENDKSAQSDGQTMDHIASDEEMEPAPQNPKTVWEDLAWFGRLVLRTAKS